MGEDAASPKVAWEIYDALRTDNRVSFLDELLDFDERWRSASVNFSRGPSMWTDAYLAAFANHYDASLVTFDRGL